jgi:hypothetical protein
MEDSVKRAEARGAGHEGRLHRLPRHALRQPAPLRRLHARRPGADLAPVQAGAGRRQTAQITDRRELPWYLTALLISQPLHFGDYGGAGMQFLWALLDVATIIVLGSGLYLWLKRGRAAKRAEKQARQEARSRRRLWCAKGKGDEDGEADLGRADPAGRHHHRRPAVGAAGRWRMGPGVVAALAVPIGVIAWCWSRPAQSPH